jgi:hypothetical protein
MNTLTAPKLLKYLIAKKHWSPFEMVSITIEIETTRDISHQIIRHRSFSYQEFSQRYADPTKEFYEMIYEPSSYWNNWSVKFLVENQIEGDSALLFSGPDRKSPWLAWGPHLWADGMRANAVDGLRWNCEVDYKPDGGGYHMSNEGKDKQGKILLDFFKNSLIAADWFNYPPRWSSCDPDFKIDSETDFSNAGFNLYPNPSTGLFYVELANFNAQVADIQVFNSIGNVVLSEQKVSESNYLFAELSLQNLPSGLYRVVISGNNNTVTKTVVLNH